MRNQAIALAAAVLWAGCAVKAPKVLPAPPPPAPKSDPPALIYPQTALELPDPQPVPPDAILKREPPPQPAVSEVSPTRTPPRRTPASTPTPAKREPEAESTSPQTDTLKPPASRTPLVPVDPALPRSDMIQKRLDALRGMHDRLASKTGGNAEMVRSRIQYFVDQAAGALARNDLRQADSLASRAEVLAQDLLRVR